MLVRLTTDDMDTQLGRLTILKKDSFRNKNQGSNSQNFFGKICKILEAFVKKFLS